MDRVLISKRVLDRLIRAKLEMIDDCSGVNALPVIVKEHSGAYGMGVDYAYTHVHKAPERIAHGKRIGPNPAR